MTSPYCAICRNHLARDTGHFTIEAEHIHTSYRDEQETYYLHSECWIELSEEWMEP